MSERGVFIAIEGGDGSGKGTQSELLRTWLESELGLRAIKFSFPRYGQDSARYAGRYLDGQYGAASEVHPELGVLPYAVDRYAAGHEIRDYLGDPSTVVVTDRYMASNLAHQGAKISDKSKRRQFYEETMGLEYDILGIPRPDINIVLAVATGVAQANVDKKDSSSRSYTTKKRDIHEADAGHLDMAGANYQELCELYPEQFTRIDCMDESGLTQRSIEDIQLDIQRVARETIGSRGPIL